QGVTLGSGTSLFAVGSVSLTPGDDPDPAHIPTPTTLVGSSQAQSFVRGLVAVPSASATTTLTSNATLSVATRVVIGSGENTNVVAAPGPPSAAAKGIGHGYELGFIPVTDGTSSTSTSPTSQVTLNGTITAGVYHELNITIPDAKNAGIYSNANAVTVN